MKTDRRDDHRSNAEVVELDDSELDRVSGGMHIEPVVQRKAIEDGKIDRTGGGRDGSGG